MKYIPADKLIAEVERLKPRLRKIGGEDVLVTTNSVYKKLDRIIDFARSLQQEQPHLPSNLDEAAKQSTESWRKNPDGSESREMFFQPHIRGFKAGAEWMAGQGVSMQITDNTEWEEVDSFIHKNVDGGSIIQIRKK